MFSKIPNIMKISDTSIDSSEVASHLGLCIYVWVSGGIWVLALYRFRRSHFPDLISAYAMCSSPFEMARSV